MTRDVESSPKTITGWVRCKFIEKEMVESGPSEILDLEVRKITIWGIPLAAPEFEYQVKLNGYASGYEHARAVFLPNRLIQDSTWTTIWKSGSSAASFGPTFPQRAAAVPGLSPFTMLMARQGAVSSSIPGLSSAANGIRNFYNQNNVTFELFEGLGGNFHVFGDDPHFIHSKDMFLPGEKTQTERPGFGWWWWPTGTGTSVTRRLYTSVHFPWKEGARSVEALFYLFKYADTVPPMTEADEDGIRHCYQWLKESRIDGAGLPRTFLEGALGSLNKWGEHLPWIQPPFSPPEVTAVPFPNMSQHPPYLTGWHLIYWGDHLLRFAIVCAWLLRALRWQGDTTRAEEVKEWLFQSTEILLELQVPWDGVFVDDEGIEHCQVDVAGGLFSGYRIIDCTPRSCKYPNALEGAATAIGAALPNAQLQQGLVPSPHASYYELSISVILAFSLAYHALD